MNHIDALSFSAGTGSSALLWMVLLGTIPRPEHFYVLNANPGMEDYRTYEYVNKMEAECQQAGIPFIRAKGPNLYTDLTDATVRKNKTRMDNPPFWTIDPVTGKKGRLSQKCTHAYKIAPMDRELRALLATNHGISRQTKRIPEGLVRKWIGFTSCEWHRCSESRQRYIQFRYPLIEKRLDKVCIQEWFKVFDIPCPPRSVCVGCYANDVEYFRTMYYERPDDFEKACIVDDAIRDMRQFGIKHICFVSSTCIPLRELAARDFQAVDREDIKGCHSGYCFV